MNLRTDSELLRLFGQSGDEAAFAELVHRHGPMVLGVCRRSLGSPHDAEDAFQVTFLILAKKARSIEDPGLLGNWLYGVAYRVAAKARLVNSRRQIMLSKFIFMSSDKTQSGRPAPDLEARLDQEISRLPAKYRAAIVTCYLEAKSNREAARILGWPQGTLVTRLNRAKEMLRRRLSDGERLMSTSVLGGTLARQLAPAIHPTLVASTARAAAAVARGMKSAAALSGRGELLLKIGSRGAMAAKTKVIATATLVLVCGGAAAVAVTATRSATNFNGRPAHVGDDLPSGARSSQLAVADDGDPDATLTGPAEQASQTTANAVDANYGVAPLQR